MTIVVVVGGGCGGGGSDVDGGGVLLVCLCVASLTHFPSHLLVLFPSQEKDQANEDLESFRKWMKECLGEKITRVEVSTRLVDSPATLVQSEYGVSPSMQKYLRAQAVVDSDDKGQFANIFNQAVLEINPSHPVIIRLKAIQETTPEAAEAKETVDMVFNTAALAAGYVLDNAAEYSAMVTKLMTKLASA